MTTHRLARLASLALLTLVAVSCSNDKTGPDPDDPNDPQNPDALGLAVGVRFDPATFPSTGEFALELVPTTATGEVLVHEQWTTSVDLDAPATGSAAFLSQAVEQPDPRDFAVALDLDNSSSMGPADPDRNRATAAQTMWTELFAQKATNRVALMDFAGSAGSDGFDHTRMLQPWTSSAAELEPKLDSIQKSDVTGSPMYRSALEVLAWIDTTTDAATMKRVLVLLTDGEPNDASRRDEVVAAANAGEVRIYTVGIAQASDRDRRSDPAAVEGLQYLANATGGLYAGAATTERLESILESFARSTASGNLVARFRLDPVPPSGTRVAGIVMLENDRGIAQAPWSFTTP